MLATMADSSHRNEKSRTVRRGGRPRRGGCTPRAALQASVVLAVLGRCSSYVRAEAEVAEAEDGSKTPALSMELDVGDESRVTAADGSEGGDAAAAAAAAAAPAVLFSSEWAVEYARGEEGCDLARGSFMWRGQGLGSNINNMLNAWVYALSVEKWSDMTVVVGENQMKWVDCGEESGGEAQTGWDCIFKPMPHLCTFPSAESWKEYMVSKDLPEAELVEVARLDQDAVRFHPEEIVASLEGSGVDHIAALAAMAKYLWSNVTPWLQADVDFVTRASPSDVFQESPFLGLHIRRGDKVTHGRRASMYLCKEYLEAAVEFLEGDDSQLSVGDIKGIWVASDEPKVIAKVKQIAPDYLPNVSEDDIFWASGGVEGGPEIGRTATRTDKETYADFVYTLADLQQLTAADLFVGTFSSNMGRLLVLLRESIGLKDRASAVSIDGPWRAGRRRRRAMRGVRGPE
ncbi:Alpha-(1,6)-fucosyltransferase, family GT23 [Ectocarpus siliculosus]|uniref:Alpha-(1,6)-fucosyltransferase, family GT23 n=1 Tax=Ectocarpus siliculosus TaxID=2880 RepID=D7G435_ECTSI|nr:Alpha-(1,6)-fucosyltransferase, family GT23 [Ectocarpus siliculosus]|eukprot:CBJ33653.1 Alpha-(1,6)-fucosyltransferase, family GT23 [Ectocarpus siliculosus]